jgi:hypothetical protein
VASARPVTHPARPGATRVEPEVASRQDDRAFPTTTAQQRPQSRHQTPVVIRHQDAHVRNRATLPLSASRIPAESSL